MAEDEELDDIKSASTKAVSMAIMIGPKGWIAIGIGILLLVILLLAQGVSEGFKALYSPKLCQAEIENIAGGDGGGTGEIISTDGFEGTITADCSSYYGDCPGNTYSNVQAPTTSKVVLPYPNLQLSSATSTYGYRIHPVLGTRRFHAGMDIGRTGDFNSIADGVVVKVYDSSSGGAMDGPEMIVKHNINGKNYFSRYLHWDNPYVKEGDHVKAGQRLAVTGTRGLSTGIHLHIEIGEGGANNIIDPGSFFTSKGATSDYVSNGDGGTSFAVEEAASCDELNGLGESLGSEARQIIIAAAKTQLGVPYVWGGMTPGAAFDCSGLTSWAYKKAGITLPRTAAQQQAFVQQITKEQAQPGDLIFWGNPAYHVAIYLGGNQMIEAATFGVPLQITTIRSGATFGRVAGLESSGDATSPSGAKAYAKSLFASKGWGGSEFSCLDKLWERESNWNYKAENPSSGAYGIPQSLPGSKMAEAGADWRTNPKTQIRWGLNYISGRYGSPCQAWAHSEAVNWY